MLSQPSFAQLPERFYAAERLPQWPSATVLQTHAGACRDLGLDPATFASEVLSRLTGNPASTAPTSWALAYAGHQFGHFVPTLGDGRAHLIGEWRDASGRDFDVQLKGSGRTVYSRGGDGRATLGSVLREYLLSACFRSLGIPTTRSLAMIATGERVVRGVGKPGAILVRAAASHVRVSGPSIRHSVSRYSPRRRGSGAGSMGRLVTGHGRRYFNAAATPSAGSDQN